MHAHPGTFEVGRIYVTEVGFKRVEEGSDDLLVAFFRMTLNYLFAVTDLKLIRKRQNGRMFLAFPSRDMKRHCWSCGHAIQLRHPHCPWCREVQHKIEPGSKRHADIAYPICQEMRIDIERVVFAVEKMEAERRTKPDYKCFDLYPVKVSWSNDTSFLLEQSASPRGLRDQVL